VQTGSGPVLLGSWCGPELSTVTSYSLMLSIHLRSVLLPPTRTVCALIIPLTCYRSVACLNVITLNTRVQTCLQILDVSSIFTECIIIQLYVHSLLHVLRHIKLVLCPRETIFHARINPLSLTFMYIMYQNSVSTALRMQTASDSKTTQVTLFREVLAVWESCGSRKYTHVFHCADWMIKQTLSTSVYIFLILFQPDICCSSWLFTNRVTLSVFHVYGV